jgi:hypothetical protein
MVCNVVTMINDSQYSDGHCHIVNVSETLTNCCVSVTRNTTAYCNGCSSYLLVDPCSHQQLLPIAVASLLVLSCRHSIIFNDVRQSAMPRATMKDVFPSIYEFTCGKH